MCDVFPTSFGYVDLSLSFVLLIITWQTNLKITKKTNAALHGFIRHINHIKGNYIFVLSLQSFSNLFTAPWYFILVYSLTYFLTHLGI